jgi:hypothetical protein
MHACVDPAAEVLHWVTHAALSAEVISMASTAHWQLWSHALSIVALPPPPHPTIAPVTKQEARRTTDASFLKGVMRATLQDCAARRKIPAVEDPGKVRRDQSPLN